MADFSITSATGPIKQNDPEELGLLEELLGTWEGRGFNQIWRPFNEVSLKYSHFLELNVTHEVLQFVKIEGSIPNRGLYRDSTQLPGYRDPDVLPKADINLFGIAYTQKIEDAGVKWGGSQGDGDPPAPGKDDKLAGIHFETGMWLSIPPFSYPDSRKVTVARLANIPHGVSLTAQGTADYINPEGLSLGKVNDQPSIMPTIGTSTDHAIFKEEFEFNIEQGKGLANGTPLQYLKEQSIAQGIVNDPFRFLEVPDPNKIDKIIRIEVSTAPPQEPIFQGGGLSNIAFLVGDDNYTGANPSGPNAKAVQMDAYVVHPIKLDTRGRV